MAPGQGEGPGHEGQGAEAQHEEEGVTPKALAHGRAAARNRRGGTGGASRSARDRLAGARRPLAGSFGHRRG